MLPPRRAISAAANSSVSDAPGPSSTTALEIGVVALGGCIATAVLQVEATTAAKNGSIHRWPGGAALEQPDAVELRLCERGAG